MSADLIAVVLTVRQFCALRDALNWDLGGVGSRVFQLKTVRKSGRTASQYNYRTMYKLTGTHAMLRMLSMRAGALPLSKAARNARTLIDAALSPKR